MSKKHECYKRYCTDCACNREPGNLCYMAPLKPNGPPSVRFCTCFTTLKPRRIPEFPTPPLFTCRTSSAFSSFVHAAKVNKTSSGIVSSAVRGSIRSGKKIPWGNC
jgi:hypothetical protein